nr:rhabdomeric opsin [Paramacrobiotus richtersi]
MGTFGRPDLVTPYVTTLPALFAKLSAIYNPIVYALMNEKCRNAVLIMLRLRKQVSNPRRFPRPSDPNIIYSASRLRSKRLSSTLSTAFSVASMSCTTPLSPTSPLAPTGLQRSSIDEGQEEGIEMEEGEGEGRMEKVRREMRLSFDLEPSVILEQSEGGASRLEASKANGTGEDEFLLTPTPMTECFGCSMHTRE